MTDVSVESDGALPPPPGRFTLPALRAKIASRPKAAAAAALVTTLLFVWIAFSPTVPPSDPPHTMRTAKTYPAMGQRTHERPAAATAPEAHAAPQPAEEQLTPPAARSITHVAPRADEATQPLVGAASVPPPLRKSALPSERAAAPSRGIDASALARKVGLSKQLHAMLADAVEAKDYATAVTIATKLAAAQSASSAIGSADFAAPAAADAWGSFGEKGDSALRRAPPAGAGEGDTRRRKRKAKRKRKPTAEESEQQQAQQIRNAKLTLSRRGTAAAAEEEADGGTVRAEEGTDANDESAGNVPPARLGHLLRVLRATTWLGGVALALAPAPLALAVLAQRNSDALPHLGGFSAAPVWLYLLYALLWALTAPAFVPVGLSSAFGVVAALALAYKLYSIDRRGGGFQALEVKVGAVLVVVLVAAHATFTVALDGLLLYVATAALGASPLLWVRAAHTPQLLLHPITTLSHALQSAATESGGQSLAPGAAADAPVLLARKLLVIAVANCAAFSVWALFGFLSADGALSTSYSVGLVVAALTLVVIIKARQYIFVSAALANSALGLSSAPMHDFEGDFGDAI